MRHNTKTVIGVGVMLAIIIAMLTACQTPQQAAYKTLGVIGMTVDKAMQGAANAVVAGEMSAEDYNTKIAPKHAKFIVAYKTACDLAGYDYTQFAPEDLLKMQSELLTAINSILTKP